MPESKITLAVYLTLSEIENDKISIRVKEGLRKAAKEGCWVHSPPYGYTNYRTSNNKSTLIPDENAKYVVDTFFLLASSNTSIRQVWLAMRKKGMLVASSTFYKLIRSTVYTGKISIKSDRGDKIEEIEGLHVPIVTVVLFEKVQKRLDELSVKPYTLKGTKNHFYPLRGHLKCPQCSKSLTASASTGSNPKRKYHYYHCKAPCRVRIPLKRVNDLFSQYLQKISIDRNEFQDIKNRIKLKVQKKEFSLIEKKEKFNKKIEGFKKMIANAEDRFFQGLIDSETFVNSKHRINDKIIKYQEKILKIEHFDRIFEFQSRVEKAKVFIDLAQKYNDASPIEKKDLLNKILKKRIVLYNVK